MEFAQVVLGDTEHASRSARRVVQCLDYPLGAQLIAVAGEEQIDHQPDDLARSEVLPRSFVRLLAEAPDQLFEHVAHLQTPDSVGMQIDVGELSDDEVEQVGLVQTHDLLAEAEPLERLGYPR